MANIENQENLQKKIENNKQQIATTTKSQENLQAKVENNEQQIDTIAKKVEDNKQKIDAIVDKIYPVGSIYMSVNATSPSTLFGGTWAKIEGRFLLGSGGGYSLGATGGEATHVLTTNEMPRHNHTFSKFLVANADGHGCWVGYNQYSIAIRHSVGGTGSLPTTGNTEGPGEGYVGNENNLETHMNATGGSQPHNNLPPYLVVNIWKRTA